MKLRAINLLLLAVFIQTLNFQDCSKAMTDTMILDGVREYFPEAEIVKTNTYPFVIQIETHVGHVSQAFVHKVFVAMIGEKGPQLKKGLDMSGYKLLVILFSGVAIVSDPSTGQELDLTPSQFVAWWNATLGPLPADIYYYPPRTSKLRPQF
jgi:hypothetical protein